MFWEIFWALILGFAISAAVQAVVAKSEMRKGGDFTSAMVFEFAATNLVIELGIRWLETESILCARGDEPAGRAMNARLWLRAVGLT